MERSTKVDWCPYCKETVGVLVVETIAFRNEVCSQCGKLISRWLYRAEEPRLDTRSPLP